MCRTARTALLSHTNHTRPACLSTSLGALPACARVPPPPPSQAAEEEAAAAAAAEEAALTGNPLLAGAGAGKKATARVKRRWDDDVVFRNQARDVKKQRKRFINDAIRSDFHRKFMNRFMK